MNNYKLSTLYDISFITFNNTSGVGIDMNANNIYNIDKIKGDGVILKYNNNNILNFNGDTVSVNSDSVKGKILDISTVNYDNIDISNIFVINDLSSDILKTGHLQSLGTMRIIDMSFINLNIQNYDSSNIMLNTINNDVFNINNILDVSNNFVLYNSSIKLNNNNNTDISFTVINVDDKNILGYEYSQSDNLFITEDVSNIIVYGKMKVLTYNATSTTGDVVVSNNTIAYLNNITTGSYTISSDDRLKHNEKDISNALQTINKINPKIYIKTSDLSSNINEGYISSGYIAQDISNNIPELNHVIDFDHYLSVNYNLIQPYITQSIKELDNLLLFNDTSINSITNRLSFLESRT
jgi:hypothetical protein